MLSCIEVTRCTILLWATHKENLLLVNFKKPSIVRWTLFSEMLKYEKYVCLRTDKKGFSSFKQSSHSFSIDVGKNLNHTYVVVTCSSVVTMKSFCFCFVKLFFNK